MPAAGAVEEVPREVHVIDAPALPSPSSLRRGHAARTTRVTGQDGDSRGLDVFALEPLNGCIEAAAGEARAFVHDDVMRVGTFCEKAFPERWRQAKLPFQRVSGW